VIAEMAEYFVALSGGIAQADAGATSFYERLSELWDLVAGGAAAEETTAVRVAMVMNAIGWGSMRRRGPRG
jgi:hypothetical protein